MIVFIAFCVALTGFVVIHHQFLMMSEEVAHLEGDPTVFYGFNIIASLVMTFIGGITLVLSLVG